MTTLFGLENLDSTGGYLWIAHNYALTSLTGLEGLTSVGGEFRIENNITLSTLTGLENLSSIGGDFIIGYNAALTTLAGLENIDASTIMYLAIFENSSLSSCEVQSICKYLDNPSGEIEIYENAPGCDSRQEVQEACWIVHIEEGQATEHQFTFYPNPVTANAKLSGDFSSSGVVNICIYNTTGLCLKSWEFNNQQSGQQEFTLNLGELPRGIYFLRLQAGNEVVLKKVVKL